MISYAGIPITPAVPPDELQAGLDKWWHGHRIEEWTYAGYTNSGLEHLPIPAPPKRESPRIGVLHWPTGASRWATFHTLCHVSDLAAIKAAIGSTPTAKLLVLDDGHVDISTLMYLVNVVPVAQRENGRDLYLLTLVDERYWWWHRGGEAVPESGSSWADLLDQLFDLLGATVAIDSVHADYEVPDTVRWSVGQSPIPLLIDAVCNTIGLRFVRQLDGTNACQSYATAAAADTAYWALYRQHVLTGGRLLASDVARGLPASVAVVFPSSSVTLTLAGLSLTPYAGVNANAGQTGRVVGDTAEDQPTYAARAAEDYYSWALSLTECTFRGLVARPITGLDGAMEWAHLPAESGIVTRVLRRPLDSNGTTASSTGQDGDCWGQLVYKTECVNGFLVQYRAEDCGSGSGADEPEWEWDQDLGVPCPDEDQSGSGSGSGGGYPTTITYVESACLHCAELAGTLVFSNVVLGAPCYEAAAGIDPIGDFDPYVRLVDQAINLVKKRIVVDAHSSEDSGSYCEEVEEGCCEDAELIGGGPLCCPEEDYAEETSAILSGPIGVFCGDCEMVITLTRDDEDLLTWSGGEAGCASGEVLTTEVEVQIICIGGQWRASGGMFVSPTAQSMRFDVPLVDEGDGILVGEIVIPWCSDPTPAILLVDRPCSTDAELETDITTDCCDDPVPSTLYAHVASAECAAVDGRTFALHFMGLNGDNQPYWDGYDLGAAGPGCPGLSARLTCVGTEDDDWELEHIDPFDFSGGPAVLDSSACPPAFELVFSVTSAGGCCSVEHTITMTINTTP